MEENYIHIFCAFLAFSFMNRTVTKKDIVFLLKEFYAVCDNVTTRADLIAFINKHTLNYTFLEELKFKLNDRDYIFNYQI